MKIELCGTVVEEDGVSYGQITIDKGRIEAFVRGEAGRESPYELMSYGEYKGKRGLPEFLIFPGFIDLYPRTPERLPALSGGVTSLIRYGTYVEPGDDVDLSDCKNVVFNCGAETSSQELAMTLEAIKAVEDYGMNARMVVSTIEAYEAVAAASLNHNIMIEVHPVNLYFDTTMVTPENEHYLKTSPPLRSKRHREFLVAELAAGGVDIISSGHSPHDITDNKVGVPELDTFGPIMAWLIENGVPPQAIFKAVCANPLKWIPANASMFGRIKPGLKANLTVLAFNKPAIEGRQIYAKCGWSPYDLRNLNGSVEAVILDGEKVISGQWVKN